MTDTWETDGTNGPLYICWIDEENIEMIPCAYLHNYDEKNRGQICHPNYNDIIKPNGLETNLCK